MTTTKKTGGKAKRTFDEWMKAIDRECSIKAGCSIHDLPDSNFPDWFEDGMSPKAAMNKAIRRAKCEE